MDTTQQPTSDATVLRNEHLELENARLTNQLKEKQTQINCTNAYWKSKVKRLRRKIKKLENGPSGTMAIAI